MSKITQLGSAIHGKGLQDSALSETPPGGNQGGSSSVPRSLEHGWERPFFTKWAEHWGRSQMTLDKTPLLSLVKGESC